VNRLLLGSTLTILALGCAAHGGLPPETSPAARVSSPRLVSTEELAAWKKPGPVSLIDVRTDMFVYLKDHLPNAGYLNIESLRAGRGGIPAQLLSAQAYGELFGRLGLRMDRPVVIYSAGETRNIDATFLAWILAGFGHPQVYVLDGGYFKWRLEQRRLVAQYPRISGSRFPAGGFHPEQASLEDVQRAIRTGDAILVDARPPDQYAGEAGAQMRRGHIPGAISHHWQDDLTQEGFGHVWRKPEELRAQYARQGITPDKNVIVYCNSATEASHVHFTLRFLLGYPRVRIYVGSWTEWAERAELPIEVGKE
jgi:thiosulfate/3-mercaptopyruvate sulfurtransferase